MLSYGDRRTRTRAILCRLTGLSDRARWLDADEFDDWEDRTRTIASLIEPGSRVLEFGAGKGLLERHLPPGCTYVSCDLVSRGPDTVVFDLNGALPDLGGNFDVAVFAGVLEYVRSIPTVLEWVASQSNRVIASYCCAQTRPGVLGRLFESYGRAGVGWVNSYSEEQLISTAAAAGLALRRTIPLSSDDGQSIFEFETSLGDLSQAE